MSLDTKQGKKGCAAVDSNNSSLFDSNWHKSPNAMIDLVMGASISPSAGWVVMTVIRYTQGIGGKQSAQIPTEVFQRVLGIKRRQTVYKFVDEAISSGLVVAAKKKGCVTSYSINENCELWFKKEVVAESVTTNENCYIGSNEKCNKVVAENATPVVTKSATLIKTKESIKENPKEQKASVNDFEKAYQEVKNHLMTGGIIPVGERVNDDFLKPEVYKFESWFQEKGLNDSAKARSVMTWFSKFSLEERKQFYSHPNEVKRNYYNPNDYKKVVPVTDEQAAAIRARYSEVFF